jgi:choline dehydrogenase-like flavoprotein
VNTPHLLALSGIGDRSELTSHGIPVVAHSPEVGRNLRDHLLSGLIVETPGGTLLTARSASQVVDYLLRRRGMLTSNVAEAYGFVRTDPALALPDIELIFAPVEFADEGLRPPTSHAVTVGAILLAPDSHGVVSLASSDPLAAPLIDPRYLSDPAGRDRATLVAGLEIVHAILAAPALRSRTTGHFLTPADTDDLAPRERAEVAIDRHAQTLYHPVGTARMGHDAASVVDPQLRVRGVNGLRVADASVMPTIIRGHTNAPSIVIGEKAADLLRADR